MEEQDQLAQQDNKETRASRVTMDFLETLEELGCRVSLVQLEHPDLRDWQILLAQRVLLEQLDLRERVV